MVKIKIKQNRYLIIGITICCLALVAWGIYGLVTKHKTATPKVLSSVSVTVSHLDGAPLADTTLMITNFGYAWSGSTDKNGTAIVPPQAIAAPVNVCALNTPRTTTNKCDLAASVDETGKSLDASSSLKVSLHNNY